MQNPLTRMTFIFKSIFQRTHMTSNMFVSTCCISKSGMGGTLSLSHHTHTYTHTHTLRPRDICSQCIINHRCTFLPIRTHKGAIKLFTGSLTGNVSLQVIFYKSYFVHKYVHFCGETALFMTQQQNTAIQWLSRERTKEAHFSLIFWLLGLEMFFFHSLSLHLTVPRKWVKERWRARDEKGNVLRERGKWGECVGVWREGMWKMKSKNCVDWARSKEKQT